MSSSLISERPLLISPSLAATIGLEEACMLSVLSDLAAYRPLREANGRQWLELDEGWVQKLMPFWTDYDIQRISKSLRDKGIIQLASAPYVTSRQLILAFDNHLADNPTQPHVQPEAPQIHPGANLISPHWQPDTELLKRIAEHNIPEYFIRQQLPEFITYWRERGEISHAWGAKFLKDVLHKWRHHQTQIARETREQQERRQRDDEAVFLQRDQETAMHSHWRPSRDALEVLVKHAGISLAFVEDAIPEFVVYWQERGDVGRTWNSKFIQHVKRQWLRYNTALEHDSEPRRLPEHWQPSKDVYDVLKLANIDLNFAQQQLPEFVLFWRDSNQLHSSWNTKFLQHVKFHWAKQHALNTDPSTQVNAHAGQPLAHPSGRTRDSSLAQQLNDRSWAS
ncbi:DnaT-like ssDNA-binding domain-containing protein [Cellvibrio japonicus]|nr:DnaT-like ssDNA-binding domain-containing protein [Cellvibrio japonicus]QEI13411.1 hypothetical protein FY117_15050 [Cellvibrio japonicus]QEI16985.1 hypothetical protein FY116_15055 [Cellvibrio japonicus]QEI20563.1 hypothetical protein FY115_15050 [Cellvibrio japonicus]